MPSPETLEKAQVLAWVFLGGTGAWMIWMWRRRNDEAPTSPQVFDRERLAAVEKRVSGQRKPKPRTPWQDVVKKLAALKRRADQIDRRGL